MSTLFKARAPSLSLNTGAPQYLGNLTRIAKNINDNRLKEQEIEANAAFREAQLDQGQQRIDLQAQLNEFNMTAEERKRKQLNERAQIEQEIIDNSGLSLIPQFMEREQVQELFANDERFRDNPEAQLKFVTDLAKNNRRQFSDPTVLADQVYRTTIERGGTPEEATAASRRAVSSAGFTTIDPDIAKALFQNVPGNNLSVTNVGRLTGGGRGSTSGTPNRQLFDVAGETDLTKLNNEFSEAFDVEGSRLSLFGWRPFDIGDHDLTESDMTNLRGEFGSELRDTTVNRVVQMIGDASDGTMPFDPRKMTPAQRQNFLEMGQLIERKMDETQPTRGNGTSGGQAISLADLAGLQQQQRANVNAFNSDLVSRLSPRADSFEDRLALFRDALGLPAVAPTQTGSGTGNNTQTGSQTTQPGAEPTGSETLDNLLNPPEAEAPTTNPIVQALNDAPQNAPTPKQAEESIFGEAESNEVQTLQAELRRLQNVNNARSGRRRAAIEARLEELGVLKDLSKDAADLVEQTGGVIQLQPQQSSGGVTDLLQVLSNALR